MICSLELSEAGEFSVLEADAGSWQLRLVMPKGDYNQLVSDATWVMRQLGVEDSDDRDAVAVLDLTPVNVLRFKRVVWNLLRELHQADTASMRQSGQFDDVTNKVDTYWIKARLRHV